MRTTYDTRPILVSPSGKPIPTRDKTEMDWAEEAEQAGYKFIRRVGNTYTRAIYRHIQKPDGTPCGAIREASAQQMRDQRVKCAACQNGRLPNNKLLHKWAQEAKAEGFRLIRKLDRQYGEYRHIHKPDGTTCGALKRVAATAMRKGHVRCEACHKWKTPLPPSTEGQHPSADPKSKVLPHGEGMPPHEIQMRLQMAGFSIPELAVKMRRSPYFIHQVIHRECRSFHVETVIAKVLAWGGFTHMEVWGRLCETDNGEGSGAIGHPENREAE